MDAKRNPTQLFWVAVFFILCVIPFLLGGPLFWYGLSRAETMNDSGESVECRQRLERVGKAFALYAADNDGALPLAANWIDATWKLDSKKNPNDDYQSAFRCPSVSRLRRIGDYGYAMNIELSGAKLSQVANPESTPLVFDCENLLRNAAAKRSDVPTPARHKGAKENYGVTSNQTVVKL